MKQLRIWLIFGLIIGIVSLSYFVFIHVSEPVTARVAVAANFLGTLEKLLQRFETTSNHKITLVSGSSGKLHTQIKNGAPLDVFFSADTKRPKMLEQDGLTVPETFFVYARGRLVLWSQHPDLVDAKGEVLTTDKFKRLAIAPIKKAPYGAAAKQTLMSLGLWEKLWPQIVQSTNLTHLHQLIDDEHVELGFLALSQIIAETQTGSQWIVPQTLYDILEQAAVLLKHGQDNVAAKAFLAFTKSPEARSIIKEFGYEVP